MSIRESWSHPRHRVLLTLLFVLYLVLLVWVVLWKLAPPSIGAAAALPRPLKLVPFVASAGAGPSAPLEILVNVALFLPFGVYVAILRPRLRSWQAAVVIAGASLLLETAQHLLSVGSFDTTDVLTNTAGGALGLGLVAAGRRRFGLRAPVVIARVCAAGTGLALLVIVAFLADPHHPTPQPDVVVATSSSEHRS